jgi:magnesium transporter
MHLDAVKELLQKQRLVEGLVRNEPAQSQGVIESLVERQHLSELEQFLAKLPVEEVGAILEALPIVDAEALWKRVPPSKETDILWEVSEELRDHLSGIAEPRFGENRINVFEVQGGRVVQKTIKSRRDLQGVQPIWVDLLNVTAAERAYVGEYFGTVLPDAGDETDLEVSSRFHIEENGELHLHSNFLLDRDGNSRSVPVAFLLRNGVLFSLRNEDLPVFRLQRRRVAALPGFASDAYDLLLTLYGTDVEYAADSLEDMYKTLSRIGKHVLSENMSDAQAAAVLADIAEEEDLNGRVRSNIMDSQRALLFLMQSRVLSDADRDAAKQILRNIESLNNHTAFLFDKINFLMDATIGFININQNRRVSQLTIFGVVFMPVNILAGMGGMSEYSMMTKSLPWPIAYGAFVICAGLLGWLTYVVLRRLEARKAKREAAGLADYQRKF